MKKLKSQYQYIKALCNPNGKKYNGSILCEEWKIYKPFEKWCLDNGWDESKAIYADKIYSPNTCEILDSKECKLKKQEINNLRKYGVKHYSQTKEYTEKIKKTSLERYGVEHSSKNSEIVKKNQNTCMKRYGVKNQFQRDYVKNKSKETLLKKYGVKNIHSSKEFQEKVIKTKIKNGTLKLYNNKLIKDIAKENNVTPSSICSRIKKYGYIDDFSFKNNSLEKAFRNILIEDNIKYEEQIKIDNKYCDFLLDNNVLIECDGLYWHSELKKDKLYHKERREFFIDFGYKPLFFYEDEILNKKNIIKSIIQNKLNNSNRIYARKCSIVKVSSKEARRFFEENHLMGSGSGRCYGLEYDNKLICAIRFKKIKNGLDISRFCCTMNTSVIGGFSKLIKKIEQDIQPDFIQTFIDLRYGSGDYLINMGFEKTSEHLSFQWVKNGKRFHRFNFKSNSGYDYGFVKIWDCGQRKLTKFI